MEIRCRPGCPRAWVVRRWAVRRWVARRPVPAGMRPMRRGTSKAMPVVVSAGLAVGVFCGLLFGVGTGKSSAAPGPSKGNNVKAHTDEMTTTPVTPGGETQNKIVAHRPDPGEGHGRNVVVTGSGRAARPVRAGSAAPAARAQARRSAPKTAKLTIKVEPDAAATARRSRSTARTSRATRSSCLPTRRP